MFFSILYCLGAVCVTVMSGCYEEEDVSRELHVGV